MEPALAGGTIIVGIDFSDSSERALQYALALAEREHASLELVHVFEWEDPVPGQIGPTTPEGANPAMEQIQRMACAARGRLGELCSNLVGDRVPSEIKVRIGDPALELRRVQEQLPGSLLVLGVLGRSSLVRGAAGHTADQICRNSPRPVLLVAPGPAPGEGQVVLHSSRGQIV